MPERAAARIEDVLSLTRSLASELAQMRQLLETLVSISSTAPPVPCPDQTDSTEVLSVLVANAVMPLQRVSEKIDARLTVIERLLVEHTSTLQRHVTFTSDSVATKVTNVGASVKTQLQKQQSLLEAHHQQVLGQSDRHRRRQHQEEQQQQEKQQEKERRLKHEEHMQRQRLAAQTKPEEVRLAPNDMSRVASMTAKEVMSHLEKTSRSLETRFDALSKYVEMITSANKTKFTFSA